MFSFKSKKDKRIEELEGLLLDAVKMNQYYATQEQVGDIGKVSTLVGTFTIEDDISLETAKEVLSLKMLSSLINNIQFKTEENDKGQTVLKGYLKVAM